jgi:outer membrane receptor for ferric coprogen and ferric-rhodotorulic acid
MKLLALTKYHTLTLITICGLVLSVAGLSVQGQETPVYDLNPFEVSDELDNGYQAKETMSGIGIATDMRDLPFTTNVITSDFIEDNLVGKFNEALDYTTSVRQTQRSEIAARRNLYTVRGFTTSRILINGIQANEDIPTNLVQRIEVVKGPNAIYGESDPGGLINVMLKQALSEDHLQFTQKIGSFGFMESSFDVNLGGAMDNQLNIRAVGSYEEYDGWRKSGGGYHSHDFGLLANYSFNENVELVFTGSTFEYRGNQSVRAAYIFNRIQPEDINGDGDTDDVVEDIQEWRIRRNSSFLPRDYTSGLPESFINRDNDFLQTGLNLWLEGFSLQYLFTYSSQTSRGYGRIFNTFSPAGVENTFFQNDNRHGRTKVHALKGFKEFYAGEVRNRLTFGARFFDDSNFGFIYRLRNANGGERAWIEKWASENPQAQIRQTISIDEIQRAHSLSEADAKTQGVDYWNDNLLPLGFVQQFGSSTNNNGLSTTDVFTANISDLITFGDNQAHLLLGLRFTDVEELGAFAGGQAPEPFKGDDISEQAGFVYNFNEDVVGFVNYATSYTGNRAVNPETGVNRPPQIGEAYEAGIKVDIYDGILSGSIGYFDIAKSNVTKSAFDPDFGDTVQVITDDVSEGVEVELYFTPIDNWQVTLAYTYMDAHADLPPTPFLPPLPLEGAAPHSYSLWTSYSVTDGPLAGLRFGGGIVIAEGPIPQSPTNANRWIIEDGYTEYDLFARYETTLYNTPTTFGVNIENANNVFFFRTRGNSNERRRAVFSVRLDL